MRVWIAATLLALPLYGQDEEPPQDETVYQMPYQAGRAFMVIQGNNGRQTHRGINAIDFGLAEGTKVFAARGGVVRFVKEDSDTGGDDEKFEQDANFVIIDHGDGTEAEYTHLQKDGVLVKVGDYVFTGDHIALSGNTGYTSGAHLHFEVRKDGKSIKVEFTASGVSDPFEPRAGRRYNSTNKPAVKPETRDALSKHMKRAKLAMKYEVFGTAHADYTKVTDLNLPDCPPLEEAKEKLEEIANLGDSILQDATKKFDEDKNEEAIGILLITLRKFAATPLDEKFKALQVRFKKNGRYYAVFGRKQVELRQQMMFHLGLKFELDGKPAQAKHQYRQAKTFKADSTYGQWAAERLAELDKE